MLDLKNEILSTDGTIKIEDAESIAEDSSSFYYKMYLANKPVFIWNLDRTNTSDTMVQLDSETQLTLPFFVLDQAKRWEGDEWNIFESLLSLLVDAFIKLSHKIEDCGALNRLADRNQINGEFEDIDQKDVLQFVNVDVQKNDELLHNQQELDQLENRSPHDQDIHDEYGRSDEFNDDVEGEEEGNADAYAKLELELKEEIDELSEEDSCQTEANLTKHLPGNKKSGSKSDHPATAAGPRKSKCKSDDQKEKVKCQECEAWFSGPICLKMHVKTIHLNIRNFRCNICKKEYSTLTMIKKHLKTAHQTDQEDYIYLKKEREEKSERFCGDCDTWLASSDDLVDHVITLHPRDPHLLPPAIRKRGPLPWTRSEAWERPDWTCPLCTEEPIYRTDAGADGMVGHFRICHPDSLLCWVCGMSFNTSQGKKIYNHMKEEHPMKSIFACTTCGLYNRTKKLLTSHNKLHSRKGTSLLHCNNCTYTTLRTDLLKIHSKIHVRPDDESKARLVCDECGNQFKSKPAHRKHVKIFHSKTEGTHECKECGKKFFQRHALIEHMNIHKETKAFSCEFCAQTFAMFSSLTKHRKRKHGELIGKFPEHACTQCEKKFWQPKELKTHIEREHNRK